MRWKNHSPQVGDTRTRMWYAWLPVTIGDETRWLETVRVSQVLIEYDDYSRMADIYDATEKTTKWENVKFHDVRMLL